MYTIQYLRTLVVFAIGLAICVACGNSPGVPAASPDITSADSAIGGAQDSAVTADSSTIVDMIGDSDVGDVSDVGTDAGSANDTADVLVCSDMPKEGCPCNASIDLECCTGPGIGLFCDKPMASDPSGPKWAIFWDCPCEADPTKCPNYPVGKLCGQ